MAVIDVDGKDSGVVEITLSIATPDPSIMREEFRRLATAIPLLSQQPGMEGALDGWTGAQDPRQVGQAEVNGVCDVTQCIVFIGFLDGPAQPTS